MAYLTLQKRDRELWLSSVFNEAKREKEKNNKKRKKRDDGCGTHQENSKSQGTMDDAKNGWAPTTKNLSGRDQRAKIHKYNGIQVRPLLLPSSSFFFLHVMNEQFCHPHEL